MDRSDLNRIFQRVLVSESGCWEYTGGINSRGYGVVSVNAQSFATHKAAYLLRRGPIPKGMCVLHACDNRKCINPDHLFLGTRGENNTDRKRKGRNADRRGELNTMAKLTDKDVDDVRQLYANGSLSQREVARRKGISQQYVSDLVRKIARPEPTPCPAEA